MKVITDIPNRRDLAIEAWLDGFGIPSAELRDFTLANIDTIESRRNQARIHALVAGLPEQYQQALQAEAVFPPLVVAKRGKRWVIVDGNNRHEAFTREGVVTHPAYVVEVDESDFQAMAMSANTLNGSPNTEDERRAHAIQLHGTGRFTFVQIANMVGLSESAVASVVHADQVRQRLSGLRVVDRLHISTLSKLDQIPNDFPLRRAVEVVDAVKPGQTEVAELVATVKRKRSEKEQLAAIDDFAAKVKGRKADARKPKGAPKRRTDLSKVRQAHTLLMAVDPLRVAPEVNGDAPAVLQALTECVLRLCEIEEALS